MHIPCRNYYLGKSSKFLMGTVQCSVCLGDDAHKLPPYEIGVAGVSMTLGEEGK